MPRHTLDDVKIRPVAAARGLAAIAVLAAVALIAPAFAQGATRYVDDDGADCSQAAHTTVQGAVDAANPGDTIRVCRGTYREQVDIPEGKDNLQLRSLPQTPGAGAILKPPPSGLTLGGHPAAILSVLGPEDVVVSGFLIEGPLNFSDPEQLCQDHTHASAVAVPHGSARVIQNHFKNIVEDCRPYVAGSGAFSGEFVGSGVHVGDVDGAFDGTGSGQRTIVDRNRFDGGTLNGVFAELALVLAQRNTIVGRGGDGSGVGLSGDFAEVGGSIRSNEISRMAIGISVFNGLDVLVHGNLLHHNLTGVDLSDDQGSSGEVRQNLSRRNGTGLALDSFAGGWLVRDNRLLDNTGDGIFIEQAFPASFQARHRLHRNRALGNGGLDCHDTTTGDETAGTANIWRSNIGRTDDPNVCRAP